MLSFYIDYGISNRTNRHGIKSNITVYYDNSFHIDNFITLITRRSLLCKFIHTRQRTHILTSPLFWWCKFIRLTGICNQSIDSGSKIGKFPYWFCHQHRSTEIHTGPETIVTLRKVGCFYNIRKIQCFCHMNCYRIITCLILVFNFNRDINFSIQSCLIYLNSQSLIIWPGCLIGICIFINIAAFCKFISTFCSKICPFQYGRKI